MTKVTQYRFIQARGGVTDFVGQFDPACHVALAHNPFAAQTDVPGQSRVKNTFLIECPGLTRKSVLAMQLLLRHLTDQPETQLSLELHIVTVEIEEEDGHVLTDHYYVVTTDTSVYLCLGGCNYHAEGALADASLETLFEQQSRVLRHTVGRHHIPLAEGSLLTERLCDYYSEWHDMQHSKSA